MISVYDKYNSLRYNFDIIDASYELQISYDTEGLKPILGIKCDDLHKRMFKDNSKHYCWKILSDEDKQRGKTYHNCYFKLDSLKNLLSTPEFKLYTGDYICVPKGTAVSNPIESIFTIDAHTPHYFAIYKIDGKIYIEYFTFYQTSYNYTECGGYDHYIGEECIGYTSKLIIEATSYFKLYEHLFKGIKIEDYAEEYDLDIDELHNKYNKILSYKIKSSGLLNPLTEREQFHNNIQKIKDDINSLFTLKINNSESGRILKFKDLTKYKSFIKLVSQSIIHLDYTCELSGNTLELFSYCNYY